jgi:serine/threonine-protein kinase
VKPDRATWLRIEPHFERLIEVPVEHRERMVDELALSARDRTLLNGLLAAHDDDGPLDRTAPELLRMVDDERIAAQRWEGRKLGPWQVTSRIADGGMSVVYAGQRIDGQFDKRVAIKVIKSERLSANPARLAEEIRILARLEHPGIARLIDSGTTEDDDPYLVMEFVEGRPIDVYCDERNLSLADSIRLLVDVAEALEYAHGRQIIHCDVKPANILVRNDGRPSLVDFGIAALTGHDRQPDADGSVFWSPGFSAPERLRNAAPEASQDVFALGAVIDELGSHRAAAIPRDLRAIIACACAERPEDRYRSMTSLRSELQSWLQRRPVTARNGGALYDFGLWLRRHFAAASLGAAFALALVAGIATSMHQAKQARAEAQRAEAVRDLLVDVFSAANPVAEDGADPRASTILRRGVERVTQRLADQPRLLADLLQVIGYTQYERGLIDDAAASLDRALSLFDATGPSIPHARALADRGMVAYEQGDAAAAIERLRQAQRMAATLDADDALRARIAIDLADMHVVAGDADAALAGVEPWLAPGRMLPPAQRARALRVRGAAEQLSGRPEMAVASLERALALQESEDADDVFTAMILNELGIALTDLGRLDRAVEAIGRSLQHKRRIYGELHPQTLAALGNLASLELMLGRHAEAERAFSEGVAALRRIHGSEPHPDIAYSLAMLAWSVYQRGDLATAHRRVGQAVDIVQALDAEPPLVAWIESFAGLVALELGLPEGERRIGPFGPDCHDLDAVTAMSRRLCLARALLGARDGSCTAGMPPRAGDATLDGLPAPWRAIHAAVAALCDARPVQTDGLPTWAARLADNPQSGREAPRPAR